jgi:hypothetical protein
MTTIDWTQIAIQLPIVAIFIWYSLELQKRYQESMSKRDEAYLSALEKIANKLDEHDKHFTEAQAKRQVRRQ